MSKKRTIQIILVYKMILTFGAYESLYNGFALYAEHIVSTHNEQQ